MRRTTIDKIIAIIVGIIVWAYVIGVKDPVTTGIIKSIPVELTNISVMESKGLAIAGTGEYTVDLVVGGNRSSINNATADDFKASADLSGLSLGQNYITVEVVSPDNLSVNEIRTQKIQVYVDTAVAQEKDIKLYTANVPDGKELGAIETEIGSVVVKGAQSLVDKVASIQVAIDGSKQELDEPSIESIELVPIDSEGNRVVGVSLSQNDVNIKSTLYETKEVALNVPIEGELNEHITLRSEIIPSSVVVKGPKDVLDKLWSLDAETIDRSLVTESCSIPLNVILPNSVELAHDYRNISVDYEVKGRLEKEFVLTTEDVSFTDLADGVSASLVQDLNLTLSIYADEEETFNKGDILVSINLDGAGAGQVSAAIESIEFSDGEDVLIVSSPEFVEVLIEEIEVTE